ncbi:MAG: transporter substrate-binding domain-containing protein [Oscillospiraceae bacterium]|nr:transporter substrate-binding domain-containing protein [Oscillospiraceae bacterium]
MRKLFFLAIALMLTFAVLTFPAAAEEQEVPVYRCGVLSLLNIDEAGYTGIENAKMTLAAMVSGEGAVSGGGDFSTIKNTVVYFDTFNELVMALESGGVDWIELPLSTANYLCASHDDFWTLGINTDGDVSLDMEIIINQMSSGFSFLMLDTNTALRDQFNDAIAGIKADGTLDALVKTFITDDISNDKPEAVAFDNRYTETIRVAVTGELPPMDYVSPDGTFAGFNTAVLAEIGKRIGMNIELVQANSLTRSTLLSTGQADVVFWTRVGFAPTDPYIGESEEEHAAHIAEYNARRENGIQGAEELLNMLGLGDFEQNAAIDIPPGTIITDPYFADFIMPVNRK